MPELSLGDITLMPIIVGLVQVLKTYAGLDSKYAPLATAILSIIGYALIVVADFHPQTGEWIQYFLNALVLFLSATGLYNIGKTITVKKKAKTRKEDSDA